MSNSNKYYRIQIVLSKNTRPVPFDNQKICIGVLHRRWLPSDSNRHEPDKKFSDYAITGLLGGKRNGDFLDFKKGGVIIASSSDTNFIANIIASAKRSSEFEFGMKIIDVRIIQEEIKPGKTKMISLSPILIKEKGVEYTFESEGVNEIMTEKAKRVIQNFDPEIDLTDFKIYFSEEPKDIEKRRLANVWLHGHKNRCSLSAIFIEGSKEAKEVLYYTGLGNSSGSGFGTLGISYDLNLGRKK